MVKKMQTGIYVDVLLTLNYVINILLLSCMEKLSGRSSSRRRMVLSAIFGAAGALTIFMPLTSFWVLTAIKLVVSAGMVLLAFKWLSLSCFLKDLFMFFAVNFFFAGIMLALWLVFKPGGMIYYNGIVYFDFSSFTLILTTATAYIALSLFQKLSRAGRLEVKIYDFILHFNEKSLALKGLVDSGNSLYEPFSGAPVIICGISDIEGLFSEEAAYAIQNCGAESMARLGIYMRWIPYSAVGSSGGIMAFKPDKLEIFQGKSRMVVENVYVGISDTAVGDGTYNTILNPDIVANKIKV